MEDLEIQQIKFQCLEIASRIYSVDASMALSTAKEMYAWVSGESKAENKAIECLIAISDDIKKLLENFRNQRLTGR